MDIDITSLLYQESLLLPISLSKDIIFKYIQYLSLSASLAICFSGGNF